MNTDLIFCGISPLGVYYSDDAGDNWHEFSEGLFCGITDVLNLDSKKKRMLNVGILGESVFRRPIEHLF